MKSPVKTFIRGFFGIAPVFITVYVFYWIFSKAEFFVWGFLKELFPNVPQIPGLGVLSFVIGIFLVGLTMGNWFMQKVFSAFEHLLLEIPLIKVVYRPMKDLMNFFSKGKETGLSRVVLVKMEGQGIQLMGLVTRENLLSIGKGSLGEDKMAVFIPLSYAIGGYTILVSKNQIQEIGITVEEAMRLSITGWVQGIQR